MLTFVKVQNPKQLEKYISQFDPQCSSWIVADLKSKQDIQKISLDRLGYYLDDSILRMSDFWQIALRRLGPEFKIVSESYLEAELELFLNSDEGKNLIEVFQIEEHQYSTLFKYLTELAPIILSPNSHQILSEWQEQNDPSWYSWYLLSRTCLNFLIQEKKIILNEWISSWLQLQEEHFFNWNKALFFDLGSEMTSVEMGLIQRMSQKNDITVFVPDPTWSKKYQFLLNTYELNAGFATKTILSDPIDNKLMLNYECIRFSTEALEIKFITHQIQSWIKQGIKPKQILAASPRLENYWEVLKIHFDYEGLNVHKKVVSNYISTGVFQLLISKILSQTGSVSWENLEQDYFNRPAHDIQFEVFKSQFIEMIDDEDLFNLETIKSIYYKKINFSEKISRLIFLGFILKEFLEVQRSNILLDEDLKSSQMFERSVKDFLSSTNENFLPFQTWFKILLSQLKSKEISIESVDPDGIVVGNIQSTFLNEITHVIWFGLDESGFKQNRSQLLPVSDVENLKYNFDFPISYPEESHIEFNLRWLSQYDFKEQIMTCSLLNNQADPLIISNFFLELEQKSKTRKSKNNFLTSMDFYQRQAYQLAGLVNFHKINYEKTSHDIQISDLPLNQLSMTEINSFDQCSFKLLVSKGFRLKDYPVKGLDLDPRQSGSLYHSLFEFLIQDYFYKTGSSELIQDFLEKLRIKNKIYLYNEPFWINLKKKLLNTALKFCKAENERLGHESPDHALEIQFKIKLNSIDINGRIDRIDKFSDKRSIVYDYKRSDGSHIQNGTEWLEKKELQMLFYLLAVTDELGGHPEGAFYYFYKNMSIKKGLFIEGSSLLEQFQRLSKKAIVHQDEFTEILNQFRSYLLELEKHIQLKKFSANPYKKEICEDCDWKELCRAQHLI